MSKNSARAEAEGVRPDPELIPLSEAAAMLGLKQERLRYYTAGTEDMVRVRQGKRIFLLRAEVERHLAIFKVKAKVSKGSS